MKFKKVFTILAVIVAAMFIVAACGRNNDEEEITDPDTGEVGVQPPGPPVQPGPGPGPGPDLDFTPVDEEDPFALIRTLGAQFPRYVINGTPIEGGDIRFAIGTTTAIPGIFCPVHWISSLDSDIRTLFAGSLLTFGGDLTPTRQGQPERANWSPAQIIFDRHAGTATFTITHPIYWHDGVPVTMDDILFAYEIIAHPDYIGPRAGDINNIVGVLEYRRGEADYISGLVLSEDRMTLTKHFVEFTFITPGSGWWSAPLARHHWDGILDFMGGTVPVSEMNQQPQARHLTLGFGPMMLSDGVNMVGAIVPGESVFLVANENYWRGRPSLDSVTVEIINPEMVPMAMMQGLYDRAAIPAAEFTGDVPGMTNVTFLSNTAYVANGIDWTVFRMGRWDAENSTSVAWPEERIVHPAVRTAIALGMNHNEAIIVANGLAAPHGSAWWGLRRAQWVTPQDLFNNFDPERAAQILDDAGFTNRDADGFRTHLDGSPMVLTYLEQNISVTANMIRELHIQDWADIGLNVEFYQGRLVESAIFIDVRQNDTDNNVVDFFWQGWGFGSSPQPRGIVGRNTINNRSRYFSDEWDAIFDRFDSEAIFDMDYLNALAIEWQEVFMASLTHFPHRIGFGILAVNNRVHNYHLNNGLGNWEDGFDASGWTYIWHLRLNSHTPYVHIP